ncbi:hypothetical protein GGI25_000485 [Coemansia spiralis]|uniref:Uncharacterized protein n=2 Tax=Coemansia TaxID=4863 RepID=A0A9W8L1G6_9FUNG|nr:hypothetical protein EDC05_000313 [Coemansia umbellata]KAJ2624114.1 hypothetical protein GGI26_001689 [Coemansia sp. RSA 1358]KAJ2680849.1 hypothetical protein GGI25_000485 [Coemansia spiralis]
MFSAQFCPSGEGWGPWSVRRELDLTPCFEHGILLPSLNGLFLVLGIHRIRHLQRLHSLPAAYCNNAAYWIKIVLASAIAVAAAVELFYYIDLTGVLNGFNVFIVAQLFHVAMLVVAVLLHHYEHIKSRRSSDILLLYWLSAGIVSLIILRTDYFVENEPRSEYSALWVARYIYSIGIAALFCVELWPRRINEYILPEDTDVLGAFGNSSYTEESTGKCAPEESANIFSRLSFAWMSPLLEFGQHKQIGEGDLWKLPAKYAPLNVVEKFDANWQYELSNSMHHTPSLLRALWKTHGAPFALAGVFKLIQDILQFTQPVLLSRLIGFVASHATDNPLPISYGFFYATAMLICQAIQTIFLHQYFQLGMVTGMKAKSSLTAAIYKKALRISNDTRQEYSTGSITTLFSVDVERIGGVTDYAHIAWSGPMQIALAIYLLYITLGWSMFAGIIVMVAAIPANGWIIGRMRQLQVVQMKNKDKRTSLIEEVLSGAKVIKLYAWERPFLQKIQHVRESLELVTLSKYGKMFALNSLSSMVVPFLVSCMTFLIYSIFDGVSHGPLTAQLIFVSLSLFNLLRFPLTVFPIIISSIVEAHVAIGRVYKLLTSDELDPGCITRLESIRKSKNSSSVALKNSTNTNYQEIGAVDVTAAVEVKDGSFKWSNNGSVILDNINLIAQSSEHLAVVGRVGSGKSSLVSALLGDMQRERGEIVIHGQIAYAPQQPWIMNATLRDNILFGLKYDEAFYNQVIDACALRPDLDILAAGDMTEIGEKGINLSGGQKARVSLARAVYARADVYVLDDPLSAVDAHVGKHLFERVLGPNGLLKSRCRIHITNAIQFITKCDSVMLLRDGTPLEYGAVADLIESRSHVYNLIQEYGISEASSTPVSSTLTPSVSNAKLIDIQGDLQSDTLDMDNSYSSQRRRSTMNTLPSASIAPIQRTGRLRVIDSNETRNVLISEEVSAVGKISYSAYIDYFRECTWAGMAWFIGTTFLSQGLLVLSNVWLKIWSSANEAHDHSLLDSYERGPMYYIAIYSLFGLASAALYYVRSVVQWSVCVVRSGRSTHQKMLDAVFHSPMSYFDTTPLGRILQRFSKDQNSVDEVIPRTVSAWLQNLTSILFSILVIVAALPAFGLVMIPVLIFFFYLKSYFLNTSRTLKRLDSTTRSPIYASFQETLVGASTIRAFNQQERFMAENLRKIDANQRCVYPYLSLNRWLAVRIEWMSAFVIFATAILGVVALLYGKGDAGLVGLSVTYALQSTQQINWMLRMECDLENSMCDFVRIQEIEQLAPEAPEVIEDNRPEKSWPEQGTVEFRGYSTRYREGLDMVLKDLSFSVRPREKVGIVGRTGAGKSSLTLALFRIVEAAEGSILVDGKDISQYGLFDLRSKLSIIPQDPVLFAGTVRENLDPFGEYSDQEIWNALAHAHLAEFIRSKDERLEFVVTQGGENFSVGQRQLICLARALLKRAKILILDEATAAIDPESDEIIQKSIRKEFKDCTVLTIAHRLNTIIDSDRILVLDKGQLAEFDTPQNLLTKENGLFYQLWNKASE